MRPGSETPPNEAGGAGPDLSAQTGAGPGRKDNPRAWPSLFAAKLCIEGFGYRADDGRAMRQRKALLAVARRLVGRDDRDVCMAELIEIARDKVSAGMDRPEAAWQTAVNRKYPGGRR